MTLAAAGYCHRERIGGSRMTRPTIAGISPFSIVADVPAALALYRDKLGFEVTFRGPTPADEFFGIVRRDGAMMGMNRRYFSPCLWETQQTV
jgi:hypothetical protein